MMPLSGIPLTDTIKKVTNDTVIETIDRNQLIAVQTPQVFTYKLMELYTIHQSTLPNIPMNQALSKALEHPFMSLMAIKTT